MFLFLLFRIVHYVSLYETSVPDLIQMHIGWRNGHWATAASGNFFRHIKCLPVQLFRDPEAVFVVQ